MQCHRRRSRNTLSRSHRSLFGKRGRIARDTRHNFLGYRFPDIACRHAGFARSPESNCRFGKLRLERLRVRLLRSSLSARVGSNMKTSNGSRQFSVRSHAGGNAAGMGQGVQPQPRDWLPPQRDRSWRGEPNPVGPRQRARRPQPPSGVWGAQPRRRAQARLPAVGFGEAEVASVASQGRASSPAPQAKQHWERSAQGCAAPTAGSRACAAPPELAARRALEAAGREGVAIQADMASSHGSTRESPLGDWPAGPASCGAWSGARRTDQSNRNRSSVGTWLRTFSTDTVWSLVRRR